MTKVGMTKEVLRVWTQLYWTRKHINDTDCKAIANLAARGSLPNLEHLWIDNPSAQLRAHCSSKKIKLHT